MNVIITIHGKDDVIGIMDAKRVLNNLYEGAEQVYINGRKIEIDAEERRAIMRQLHGELYV